MRSSSAIEGNMEEAGQSRQTIMDPLQLPLGSGTLQTNQIMGINSPLSVTGLTTQFPYQFPPHQIAQHVQHQQLRQEERQLQIFWANQMQEIRGTNDFRNHNLPLARIKKIMKADEDVKMIAAEAPVLFSRACEMFILELTYRSWSQAEHSKRRTLQKSDISGAIAKHQVFDFLIDIVPMEEIKEAGALPMPEGEELNDSVPYLFDPSKFGSLMMDMGHPEFDFHGFSYNQQQQQDCTPQQIQEQHHQGCAPEQIQERQHPT